MNMMKLIIFSFLASCAGYQLVNNNNPLDQYEIRSLTIPKFVNNSNLPNVGGVFTGEVVKTLTPFKSLRIGGKNTDAHLIGVVESPLRRKETVVGLNKKSAKATYPDIIPESRDDFFVATSNKVKLQLRLILLKHPSKDEIEAVKKLAKHNVASSKIVFNEVITVDQTFSLKELSASGIDVLGTQNKGLERKAIKQLAVKAAKKFRDTILYAY